MKNRAFLVSAARKGLVRLDTAAIARAAGVTPSAVRTWLKAPAAVSARLQQRLGHLLGEPAPLDQKPESQG